MMHGFFSTPLMDEPVLPFFLSKDCGAERCHSWSFVPLMSLSTLNGKQGKINNRGLKVMEVMKESVYYVMDYEWFENW